MTEGHLESLLTDLRSEDGMTRKRSREVLALVGDPAVPRLEAMLAEPDKKVRWEATKTLAAIVAPSSLDLLAGNLDDARSEIRWLAATGLISLGPRSVAPVLRALSASAVSRGRAEMSHRVLRELSADNDTLARLTVPVLDALDSKDSALIAAAAASALSRLEHVVGRFS